MNLDILERSILKANESFKVSNFLENDFDSLNVFCEIGVHGWNECRLKKQIEANKHVVLVEPLPDCCNELKEKCLGFDNTIIHQLAVADSYGETEIYNEGQSAFITEVRGRAPCHILGYYDSPGARMPTSIDTIKVKKVTFDYIDPGDIDVLLIDTEGAEYFAIKNMVSQPKLISVETHYRSAYRNPYISQICDWMRISEYSPIFSDESDTLFVLNSAGSDFREAVLRLSEKKNG